MSPQASIVAQFIPIIFILLFFYLIIIRPQQKKQQEHQKMIESIGKNDQIITIGGIHGTVVNVKEKTFIIRVDENSRLEIDKSAVATLIKKRSS